MPLLIDREIDLRSAMLIILRALGHNPIATAVWVILSAIITGLSVATLILGFLILHPVLGHVSWHVYRNLVDASQLMPGSMPGSIVRNYWSGFECGGGNSHLAVETAKRARCGCRVA